ncbi:hypothetical protein MAC3UK_0012 [Bdellovibrio phage MAC3UK]|nr:hypothetical protein MAC3UK_0012 [Bdellovibrio phage MAC3UK]
MSSSLLGLIGFKGGSANPMTAVELPEIFPLPIIEKDFITLDVQTTYSKILTEVLERTQGIPDDRQVLLWDNCVASESKDGLITMLAKAMAEKAQLFLVYDAGLKVIRKADSKEQSEIEADFKKNGKSEKGIFITFAQYRLTEMLKIYSALEYFTVSSLYKNMNLSKAIQLKFHELRASVASGDSEKVIVQAKAIAEGLKKGFDVALDAKDIIECAKPDMTATNSSMDFINQKRSYYLGLPAAWITGLSNKGLGDSGSGEAKAVERGLRRYYFAIIKPVIETLFKVTTTFKTEDYEGLTTALSALQTFELTEDEYLSADDKKLIIGRLFGTGQNKSSKT